MDRSGREGAAGLLPAIQCAQTNKGKIRKTTQYLFFFSRAYSAGGLTRLASRYRAVKFIRVEPLYRTPVAASVPPGRSGWASLCPPRAPRPPAHPSRPLAPGTHMHGIVHPCLGPPRAGGGGVRSALRRTSITRPTAPTAFGFAEPPIPICNCCKLNEK